MIYGLDARTATNHFPGIGRYVSSLAGAIVPHLKPGERLALFHDPQAESRWELPPESEQVARHPVEASPFGISQQFQLPALLKYAAIYHSPYYLQPYFPGVPGILTVYDLIPLFLKDAVPSRTRIIFLLANWFALRASRHAIAISETTRRDYIRRFKLPPDRVTTIPLAPAEHLAPQSENTKTAARQKYGLPENFILYIGSNKPHKNIASLVQVLPALPKNIPLVIGGAWDPRYPQSRQLAERLSLQDRTRFLGPLPDEDLPGLLSACTLFVFPSLYEGFGLPVIEAMACGAPVACSNTSSLPEAGGDAAAYFDPEDSQGIQDIISDLLASPARLQIMSDRSLEQAARFSWQQTARATVEIYRSFAYNTGAGT